MAPSPYIALFTGGGAAAGAVERGYSVSGKFGCGALAGGRGGVSSLWNGVPDAGGAVRAGDGGSVLAGGAAQSAFTAG